MTDQMQSEIAELNLKIEEIDDPRRAFALVQERIKAYKQLGHEIPADLALIERSLAIECRLESQGR